VAKRSPILGYNHNFRHRGRVFHVQTEDSGVDNPHIFTHLFNGGVILNTRKLDYDASADEDVVKSLMQSQHKAVIKELRAGTFDQKIVDYLGPHPEQDAAEPAAESVIEEALELEAEPASTEELRAITSAPTDLDGLGPTAADVSGLFDAIQDSEIGVAPVAPVGTSAPVEIHQPAPAVTPSDAAMIADAAPAGVTTYVQAGGVAKETPLVRSGPHKAVTEDDLARGAPPRTDAPSSRQRPSSLPPPVPSDARPSQRQAAVRPPSGRGPAQPATHSRRAAGGVVVSRPAVIINSPSKVVGGPSAAAPPPSERARAQPAPGRVAAGTSDDKSEAGLFGQDLISEKSLDEVILAYLSEDGDAEK